MGQTCKISCLTAYQPGGRAGAAPQQPSPISSTLGKAQLAHCSSSSISSSRRQPAASALSSSCIQCTPTMEWTIHHHPCSPHSSRKPDNNQNCYTATKKRASTAATFSMRDTVEQETKSVAIAMQWHTHQQRYPSIARRNPTSRWRRQCTRNAWQVCDAALQGPTNATADVPILPNRSEQSDMSLVSEERPLPYVQTVWILPLSCEICL